MKVPTVISIGISLGLLCSAAVTGFGLVLASGLFGHPVDGQLPSDWGWSLVMMGSASLLAFGIFGWRRNHPDS
ncbi:MULTISPECIES: hypothetical protein [unclassified Methylobacterium]|uniref:hypothetical protein n=1 Tax=unclassified Methylobacterium TaxID=2615210 RepID=UPI0006F88559|nr:MULTISPECIES: hypothetical protein [unclassified Methylobacterium]KQP91775.1 hypothetical protein ASF57_04495 [Methylobacterium sp. Leaf117]